MRNDTAQRPAEEILPLTGLRFVAAFYVFLFHIQRGSPVDFGPLFNNFLLQGAAGMTLFFLLSGYVLAYRYAGKPLDPAKYFWNRVGRIYPVYLVAALIMLPYFLYQLHHNGWPLLQGAVVAVADISLIQAWFPKSFGYWNNSASWSISAEAFFYALFPILIWALSRVSRLWLAALFLYVASILPGMAYYAFDGTPEALTLYYVMPIFRLPEFALGIVAFLGVRHWSGRGADWILASALAALLIGLGSLERADIYVTNNWIVVPAICGIVIAAAKGNGFASSFLGSAPLVWLGKVSYCFYSFQPFALTLVGQIRELVPMTNTVALIASFALLLALAGMGFHWIEEPLRRRIRQDGRSRFPIV